MKIISLEAENIKRISAVHIEPDGSLVQITGANGQGKTSVLDAIWWALQGGKNIQTTPIRKGEEKATIKLDLGQYQVVRTFTAKEDGDFTTKLKVTTPEGAQFSSPQQMLDELLGELTFDPLAFTRMKPNDQISALRGLAPDFDFAANSKKENEAFAERTFANRRARESAAAVESLSKGLPETIPDHINNESVMVDWQNAQSTNADISERKRKRDDLVDKRAEIVSQIAELEAKLKQADTAIESWADLPVMIDVDAIKQRMNSAAANNAIVDAAARANDKKAEQVNAETEAAELTKIIDDCKAAERAAIAAIEIPIDGLSITEECVALQGLPFDQASDAQQLQASIGVAMALNPKLKVIRVRDGSLLDHSAMTTLAKIAEENDYQVWIERVDTSGEVGFVIEDGMVKTADTKTDKPSGLFG